MKRNFRKGRGCGEGKISPGGAGGKAAIRRATSWHALRRETRRRDATCKRGRGQVLQARHYVYHTKRPRDALPADRTGCLVLRISGIYGDKNRLPGLAFSFNRGVKRPARSRPRYWTFRHRLRVGSLCAEIHRTMWVVTLVCHLVNLFFPLHARRN